MYVSTINPNQLVATTQGYQSSATASPIAIRPSLHGNTVTYSLQFVGPVGFNTIQSSSLAQMRVDLHETNSDVTVAAELPNVNLNDLNLTVTDDSLSISATAFAGNKAISPFRIVALPTSIKAEQVEATYSNGILEIRAPKSDVATRRKVKVNIA